jgi:pimeloyl-ACP methyl ester carboxylesterase
MPADEEWNGDLVVYAHGYISPEEPIGLPEDQLVLPDGTSFPKLLNQLGFAFATTSYPMTGLVVKEGMEDLVDLMDLFTQNEGQPEYAYLVGASEGGLITALTVERHPDVFDGALAACGPVGSFQRQINYWGDVRVLLDYFFPDVIPGSPVSIPPDVLDNWTDYQNDIEEALSADPDATAQLLRAARVPLKLGDPAANAASLVQLLWYNVFATNDGVAKLFGQPYDNRGRFYFGSHDDWRLNREIARFDADQDALDEIEAHYQTSGEPGVPIVTLHTTRDPIVPYWHEPIYRWRVRASGNPTLHTNIPIPGHGHCNFTVGQALFGFGLLVFQVRNNELQNLEAVLTPEQLDEYRQLALDHGAEDILDDTDTSEPIGRDLEPVIVSGESLPHLQGAPTDSFFVYTYQGDAWRQIPFQMDEKASGAYTSTLGSPLDGDDELVFMASDLGERPSSEELAATLPISPTWYRIEVTNPLSPTQRGWAYVVHSSSLTRTFTRTYAAFDSASSQITTTRYAIGLEENHPYFDHLSLNQSGVNVLDRTKIRIHTLVGALTEEAPLLEQSSVHLIKDGPVRVIARQGSVIGYQSMVQTSLTYTLPTWLSVSAIRVSTDFNENALSSTFYNAGTPAGVSVDGIPDSVPAEPLSPWWQLSGATGTVVQVSDTSQTGGNPTNYYRDEADRPEPNPTGDGKSYGDSGIRVDSPAPTVSYLNLLYVLPSEQPGAVGAQLALHAVHPLHVVAVAPTTLHHQVYLPLLMRGQ